MHLPSTGRLVLAGGLALLIVACDRGERPGGVAGIDAEAAQDALLMVESEELEELFDEEVAAEDVPTEAQLQVLENALIARREYLELRSDPPWGEHERLRLLEVKYATARARRELVESERFEQRAAEWLAEGRREEAVRALQEAVGIHRAIHESVADDSVRHPAREAALTLRWQTLEAEPLAGEVERLEAEARSWAQAGDVARGEALLREAMGVQERINRDFPRTGFAGTLQLARLESVATSMGAMALAGERDRLAAQALGRAEAGAGLEAALHYERARELQERINREWPGSVFADPALPGRYEALRQRALTVPTP